jgi:phenylpropionate dioxygenase-like ring-hydroxylating dioxygenase large terminal subunit
MNARTRYSGHFPETEKACVSPDGAWVSRRVFTDVDIYKREQERIFKRTWLYLGHESQLKRPGDFVTAYMGETPIILSRTAAGEITACVNSCSHRGVAVCRVDKGNAARFVCPYHNWTFSVGGDLLVVPQTRRMNLDVDKKDLGLKKVPRIESTHGFIFGSLDPDIIPLDTYLGDQLFYLDALYGRFPAGLVVMGSPVKWQLPCNWKVPVENMLGDYGHGVQLHSSFVSLGRGGVQGATETLEAGEIVVPVAGHSAKIRLFPEGTDPEILAYGLDSPGITSPDAPPHWKEYLLDIQRQIAERLSPLHSRLRSTGVAIYPNFSTQWLQHTIKVTLPRGPNKVDYWSWVVVPADAPDDLKEALRIGFNRLFGPGGGVEQEDSFAWSEQCIGSNIHALDDTPYCYGLGLNEEGPHPELPGKVGGCYNEHYARSFYLRWQQDLLADEDR